MNTLLRSTCVAILALSLLSGMAEAADKKSDKKDAPVTEEKVEVDAIKEKYWARGQESQVGVVQNRLYSKSRKVQLSLLGGVAFSDPFLSVKQLGLSAGYHFNEYISVHALAWYYFVTNSTANTLLIEQFGGQANTNIPKYFVGLEVSGSLLYGKLSVLGKKIIYYDMHLLGGVGATATDSGTYVTPSVGAGQQIFLNKVISIGVDYRLQIYRERIIEQASILRRNELAGYRNNFNHTVSIGLNFLIGKDKK